ncbi:hypothetical protein PR048_032444 [Dryococelus australis]|uniref:Uncharacterized protein n=1 Tax=Dryococelus australis TaxID=614101 RepID=A0ABQ9G284_9NEOP|nr:hypothetical protein PR048_032444 [Dryococelus australis]
MVMEDAKGKIEMKGVGDKRENKEGLKEFEKTEWDRTGERDHEKNNVGMRKTGKFRAKNGIPRCLPLARNDRAGGFSMMPSKMAAMATRHRSQQTGDGESPLYNYSRFNLEEDGSPTELKAVTEKKHQTAIIRRVTLSLGATVAERLARSPPTRAIRVDDAVGRRVFSWISLFPRPFIPALLHTRLNHPHRSYDGNTARLARRSDEEPGVRVSVARIAPSLLDFGRGVPTGTIPLFNNTRKCAYAFQFAKQQQPSEMFGRVYKVRNKRKNGTTTRRKKMTVVYEHRTMQENSPNSYQSQRHLREDSHLEVAMLLRRKMKDGPKRCWNGVQEMIGDQEECHQTVGTKTCAGGRGDVVVRLFASHLGGPDSNSSWVVPGYSQMEIVTEGAAGRRSFLGGLPLSPALGFRGLLHAHLALPHVGSLDLPFRKFARKFIAVFHGVLHPEVNTVFCCSAEVTRVYCDAARHRYDARWRGNGERKLHTMSAYTRQKAKSKYRNSIRLERASQKQPSDTHVTPYNRVKRRRERKINIKASERVNVDVFTQNKRSVLDFREWESSPDDAADRRVFSGISRSPHPLHSGADPYLGVLKFREKIPRQGVFREQPSTSCMGRFFKGLIRKGRRKLEWAIALSIRSSTHPQSLHYTTGDVADDALRHHPNELLSGDVEAVASRRQDADGLVLGRVEQHDARLRVDELLQVERARHQHRVQDREPADRARSVRPELRSTPPPPNRRTRRMTRPKTQPRHVSGHAKFALRFVIRLNFTALFALAPASFFHWLMHRSEDTPSQTEPHVIGAHNCEVFLYWRRVTQGVSHKVWSNDKLVAKELSDVRSLASEAVIPHTFQYGILFLFPFKSAIGSDSSRAGIISSDLIAKCRLGFAILHKLVHASTVHWLDVVTVQGCDWAYSLLQVCYLLIHLREVSDKTATNCKGCVKLDSPLVDDRPIMNPVKFRVVSGVDDETEYKTFSNALQVSDHKSRFIDTPASTGIEASKD